jgi:hypothetical protein
MRNAAAPCGIIGGVKKRAKAGGPARSAKAARPARSARAAKPAQRAVKPKKAPAARTMTFGRRADLGAPIDGFFAKQPPALRAILEELRRLVEEAAADATSSIKWGMPFFTIGAQTMCALAGFRSHVNLILAGPPGTFADPDGRLEGDGKTGRHLKLRALDELPRAAVRGWLRTAAERARQQARPAKSSAGGGRGRRAPG